MRFLSRNTVPNPPAEALDRSVTRWRQAELVWRIAISAIAAALIANTLLLVWRFHDPLPFIDQWAWTEDYRHIVEGHHRLGDWFAQHNEHRIVTTRLILLADAVFFRMTGDMPLLLILLLLAAIGLALWRLWPPDAGRLPALLCVAWMMSACQVGNLIMAFQVQFPLLLAFMIAAAAAFARSTEPGCATPSRRLWFAAGVGFYLLDCLSMAGGLLAGPPLLLLLYLRRAHWRSLAAFACTAILVPVLYQLKPIGVANTAAIPLQDQTTSFVLFALRFCGSALRAYPGWRGAAGILAVAVSAFCLAWLLRDRWRGHAISARPAISVALAGFVIANACAAARDRGWIGPEAAFASRYATMSLVLLGCAASLLVTKAHRAGWATAGRNWRIVGRIAAQAFAVLLLLMTNLAPEYRAEADARHAMLNAVARELRENVDLGVPYGPVDFETLAQRADTIRFLRAHHLSLFAPSHDPPGWVMARLSGATPAALPPCRGALESAEALDARRWHLRFWLADPDAQRSAPWAAVIDADGQLAGIAEADARRRDLAAAIAQRRPRGTDAGFTTSRRESVPIWAIGLFSDRDDTMCALRLPDLRPADPSLGNKARMY